MLNLSAGYSMNRRDVSLFRLTVTVFGGALLLTGCAFSDEALLPSLTGEDPAGQQAQAQPQPVQVQPQPVGAGPGLAEFWLVRPESIH